MAKKSQDIDEMYDELTQFKGFIKHNVDVKKNSFANQIEEFGTDYLADVNVKEQKKEKKRQEKIKYIIKHSKEQFGDKHYLMNTPLEDIESIYTQVKESRGAWYKNILDFIMGWENNG